MNKFIEAIKPTPSTWAVLVFVVILSGWNYYLKNKKVEIPVIDEALMYEEVTAQMSPTTTRAKSVIAMASEASRDLTVQAQPVSYRLGSVAKEPTYTISDLDLPKPDLYDTNSYSYVDYGVDKMTWVFYADILVTHDEISAELFRLFGTDDYEIHGLYTNNQLNHSDKIGFVAAIVINGQAAIINVQSSQSGDIEAFKIFY